MPFKVVKTDGKGQWQVEVDGEPWVISGDPSQEPSEQFSRSAIGSNSNDARANNPVGEGNGFVSSIENVGKNFLTNSTRAVKNPDNWSTIGGIGAAGATSLATGGAGIPAVIAAMVGGGAGEGAREVKQGEDLSIQNMGVEGAKQGAFEGAAQLPAWLMKRLGAGVYAQGMGLNKTLRQNFPAIVDEGLDGAKFGVPMIRSKAWDIRTPNEIQVKKDMVSGITKTGTVDEIANAARPYLMDTAKRAVPDPTNEAKVTEDVLQEFLHDPQRSNITPAVPPTYYNGQRSGPIQLTPGVPASRTPKPLSGNDIDQIKMGAAERSNSTLKGLNAGKFPANIEGRVTTGISNAAKKWLENEAPGLDKQNRTIQGLMGGREAVNGGGRSEEELISMGMDPAIANVMASNAGSGMRLQNRMLAGGVASAEGGILGGLKGALFGAGIAHAVTSPVGERVAGAALYKGGKYLPAAARAVHGAVALTPEEQALLDALNGK